MHEMDNYFDELIDRLLDEKDIDNVELVDDSGNKTTFEQVAAIPLDEKIYVILLPILSSNSEKEALVFLIDEEEEILKLITDEKIIDDVFAIYYSLCEAEEIKDE